MDLSKQGVFTSTTSGDLLIGSGGTHYSTIASEEFLAALKQEYDERLHTLSYEIGKLYNRFCEDHSLKVLLEESEFHEFCGSRVLEILRSFVIEEKEKRIIDLLYCLKKHQAVSDGRIQTFLEREKSFNNFFTSIDTLLEGKQAANEAREEAVSFSRSQIEIEKSFHDVLKKAQALGEECSGKAEQVKKLESAVHSEKTRCEEIQRTLTNVQDHLAAARFQNSSLNKSLDIEKQKVAEISADNDSQKKKVQSLFSRLKESEENLVSQYNRYSKLEAKYVGKKRECEDLYIKAQLVTRSHNNIAQSYSEEHAELDKAHAGLSPLVSSYNDKAEEIAKTPNCHQSFMQADEVLKEANRIQADGNKLYTKGRKLLLLHNENDNEDGPTVENNDSIYSGSSSTVEPNSAENQQIEQIFEQLKECIKDLELSPPNFPRPNKLSSKVSHLYQERLKGKIDKNEVLTEKRNHLLRKLEKAIHDTFRFDDKVKKTQEENHISPIECTRGNSLVEVESQADIPSSIPAKVPHHGTADASIKLLENNIFQEVFPLLQLIKSTLERIASQYGNYCRQHCNKSIASHYTNNASKEKLELANQLEETEKVLYRSKKLINRVDSAIQKTTATKSRSKFMEFKNRTMRKFLELQLHSLELEAQVMRENFEFKNCNSCVCRKPESSTRGTNRLLDSLFEESTTGSTHSGEDTIPSYRDAKELIKQSLTEKQNLKRQVDNLKDRLKYYRQEMKQILNSIKAS